MGDKVSKSQSHPSRIENSPFWAQEHGDLAAISQETKQAKGGQERLQNYYLYKMARAPARHH
jgi:hypothetical protein